MEQPEFEHIDAILWNQNIAYDCSTKSILDASLPPNDSAFVANVGVRFMLDWRLISQLPSGQSLIVLRILLQKDPGICPPLRHSSLHR